MTLSFKHPNQKLKNWVAFLFAGLVTINLISLLSRQSLCKVQDRTSFLYPQDCSSQTLTSFLTSLSSTQA